MPASVKRGLLKARKMAVRAPEIIATRSKNIQLRNEVIHARMADELRTKAVLKQGEAVRLKYKKMAYCETMTNSKKECAR